MEEYAYVLEYMPAGRSDDPKREPIVQLIGFNFFTLLEASAKPEATLVLGKKVYVGKDERPEINRIKRKVSYQELTTSAKDMLPNILRNLIGERETEFVNFLNKARPISMRVHTLDLLPGIGKKHMAIILEEREKKTFESFEDIKKRVTGIDPILVFTNRIISELKGEERHNLFVMGPAPQKRY
ncbi:MAG: DUF655 domain-containing protein [Candidatus Micrarchaeia archaeon]|jgi:putative nucleotide binding protein